MILGYGNAIVDLVSFIDDDLLNKFNLKKNSMNLVDSDFQQQIIDSLDSYEIVCGGAVANTIDGIAKLNTETAFIGSVSNDKFGKFFIDELEKYNTKYDKNNIISNSKLPTATSVILITPDHQRTMCTSLGSAGEIKIDDFKQFSNAKYTFTEAYICDAPHMFKLYNELVKNINSKNIFSLADPFCVTRNYEKIEQIILSTDILISNKEEIIAFTQMSDYKEITDYIYKKYDRIKNVIVTDGKNGAYSLEENELIHIPAQNVNVIDTTGAGDQFAAGFIYAISQGSDIKIALEKGIEYASQVIQIAGARIK